MYPTRPDLSNQARFNTKSCFNFSYFNLKYKNADISGLEKINFYRKI